MSINLYFALLRICLLFIQQILTGYYHVSGILRGTGETFVNKRESMCGAHFLVEGLWKRLINASTCYISFDHFSMDAFGPSKQVTRLPSMILQTSVHCLFYLSYCVGYYF